MPLDKRLNAYREDIADLRLKGDVEARSYVAGRDKQVKIPIAGILREPRPDAMQMSQALMGEVLRVFDDRNGWSFVQLARDGYVGYIRSEAITAEINKTTHRVSVLSTLVYPRPDLRSQPAISVTMNAELAVTAAEGKFLRLAGGFFVFAGHARLIGDVAADYVAVASQFLGTPYYWGGKSVFGLDCSALVQLSLEACGTPCLRDSDMQEGSLGHDLDKSDLGAVRRGDLLFWKGHVGIAADGDTLLHANGHYMQVVAEPLTAAVARIAAADGALASIRRLQYPS